MNNKTALITGCNRGLGEGIRNILLKQGYTVIGLNRTLSNQKLKNYIEVKCDISNSENIEKAKEKINKKIDLLIINAGIRRFEKIENMKKQDWEDSVNINLNGAYYTLNSFIENVKNAKGVALRGMSECLRDELRYEDVRVSYLSLGSIKNRDHNIYEEWKLMPEEVGMTILNIINLPKKILIPYLDIRPLQPLKDEKKGIEKLQYV